jgi:hypothetical protein
MVFYRNFTEKSRNFYVNYCFANYFLRKNYVNFIFLLFFNIWKKIKKNINVIRKMVNLRKELKKSGYFDFGKNQVKSRKFT